MHYTIILAYEPHGSPWHPTESSGPFATLVRGHFKSEEAAHDWALQNIAGYAYKVRPLDEETGERATYADTGETVEDIPGRAAPPGTWAERRARRSSRRNDLHPPPARHVAPHRWGVLLSLLLQ